MIVTDNGDASSCLFWGLSLCYVFHASFVVDGVASAPASRSTMDERDAALDTSSDREPGHATFHVAHGRAAAC